MAKDRYLKSMVAFFLAGMVLSVGMRSCSNTEAQSEPAFRIAEVDE
jgi:hypothetical protein